MQNMSPHPVIFGNLEWRTAEALFQALRFVSYENGEVVTDSGGNLVRDEHGIVTKIWRQKSPMGAKMVTKSVRHLVSVEPYSGRDLDNMLLVLNLKLQQHPDLAILLSDTGDDELIEDCSRRMGGSGLFWGAALMPWGRWIGENHLGKLWMDLREDLRRSSYVPM